MNNEKFLNNGEKVFVKQSRASFAETEPGKAASGSEKIKLQAGRDRFKAVSQLTGRLSSSTFRYNPVESPSAKLFTQNNAEIFPNKPATYDPPKQEALQTSVYLPEMETKAGIESSKDETDEDISEIAESVKQEKKPIQQGIKSNGDSGFNEQVQNNVNLTTKSTIPGSVVNVSGSSETDEDTTEKSDRELLKSITQMTPLEAVVNPPELYQSPPKDGRASTAVQTSPISWMNIPGVIDFDRADFINYLKSDNNERRYFVYLIQDSNPYFKKDCIGRISIPKGKITLSELREYMLKSDDENLRYVIRKNQSFRFLSETYRFVAQNEAIAPVDEVYPAQGIFIKINQADVSIFSNPNSSNEQRARYRRAIIPSFITVTSNEQQKMKRSEALAAAPSHQMSNPNRNPQPTFERGRRRSRFSDHFFPGELSDEEASRVRDASRRRHEQCLSPVPVTRKVRIRRKNLIFTELKKFCENPNCTSGKRSILKCGKCNVSSYCSLECKREHWQEHKFTCTKPPWRL
ncbi:hypothetical protein B4U79_18114 [Dinothrombium tinctorium]|uniref:MYND-type domain-containing protein n=1 Tax=Dinothrombium tinctorium TaxID=1965070 RepID=A0A443R2R5_9ACAR|nr:hypothetical protein B4U79_18114 [Dinothrombium tinctorium]